MANKLLIDALKGETTPRVPFWFMRQAGRYLPEYRRLRADAGSFLDLCFNSEKAAEVTLQPLRRFGMDAAILFSDILVIPYALGVDVRFAEGEGPIVEITDTSERIEAFRMHDVRSKLSPIADTIRRVRADLPREATLIGFAGAPWTVACYMLQGKSGKEFALARQFAIAQPELMARLIERLTVATIDYLRMQVDAGAEVLQLFDSWAGLLTPEQFHRWVIPPAKKIAAALKQSHPHIPFIGFAKGAALNLEAYAHETNVDCIGVDQHTPMEFALACRDGMQTVQGNLDPLLMAFDREGALRETEAILRSFGNAPAVFNVGHGFIPQTPIENVAAVSELVKNWRRA
ncbi:MAG: uroporphyrinogen decarboxylase [Rickettsiales bacterium]